MEGGLLRAQADGFGELAAGRRRQPEPDVRAAKIIVDERIVGSQNQFLHEFLRGAPVLFALEKPSRVVDRSLVEPGQRGVGPDNEDARQKQDHPDPRHALAPVHGPTLPGRGEAPMSAA